MAELLKITNLDLWYEPNKKIIQQLSLTLKENSVIGLVGRNGAGKTTLIKFLSSLLPGYQVGQLDFMGKSIKPTDKNYKKQQMIVFDEDLSFEYFSFYQYLDYIFASYQKPVTDVSQLIAGFGFGHYTETIFKDLSMGNRKKVFLIVAFALQLPLLILDEPVNGLDFDSTEFLYKSLIDYKKYGSIFFSSHVMESMTMTADQILILESGQISHHFEGKEIDSQFIRKALNVDDV